MHKEVHPSYKLEDHVHEQWNQLKEDNSSWRYCQNSLSLPSFFLIREEYQKIFEVCSNSSYLSLANQFLKETKHSISFTLYPSLRLCINATIKKLERFPFPSIIVSRKLNKSGLEPNKVENSVFNQGKIGVNDLLLLDEIY